MGILFAVLTAAFWSLYNFVVRRGRDLMDPGAGYLLTLLINVVSNLVFVLLPLPGAGAAGLRLLPVLYFVLAGLSTTLMGRWLLFESVYILGPSRASAWKNAAPVYTLILGALFLHERITLLSATGVIATLAGMWWLAHEQEKGLGQGGLKSASTINAPPEKLQRLGLLFGIGSGLAFSLGFLLRRAGLLIWPDAAWGSLVGALAALVSYAPIAIGRGEVRRLAVSRGPGLRLWLAAGVLSSLAQLCTFLALRVVPSAITQVVTSLEPVFTMALSLMLLGRQENLNARLAMAVGAICLGVVLVIM